MLLRPEDVDTICALSTPPGRSGIAVVRISGPKALELAKRVCPFLKDKVDSHRVYFGTARSLADDDLDEVLLTYFETGRSFTGEETVEISTHGNPTIVTALIQTLVSYGCRTANKGEFTYRAYMNGRMDLVQAESVLSLIESQSTRVTKLALRQLKGSLSRQFAEIEDDLLWLLANLEASIDFSTEDIEVIPSRDLILRADRCVAKTQVLLASFRRGRILREGLLVALVGRPNVGKSSLLNSLLEEDRAIVTDVPGTTRDLVEGQILIDGVVVRLVDTAGLRETSDKVELIGIKKSREMIEVADLVFLVTDLSEAEWLSDLSVFKSLPEDQAYIVINKCDQDPGGVLCNRLADLASGQGVARHRLLSSSCVSQNGLEELKALLNSRTAEGLQDESEVLMQARHFENLEKIHSCLLQAITLIKENSSPDFIAFELRDGVRAIHELLGKEFHEQVIDRIFKEFCLGK